MAAVTSHALGVAQAFAGDSRQFGGRTLEWPWYGFWAKSFHSAVDIETVIAGPQSEITKEQLTNDDKIKRKKKIPDFVLQYVVGRYQHHDINSILQVTNHEELRNFYMGRYVITDSALLAICEIKAYPDPWHMKAGPTFRSDLAKQSAQTQWEAQTGAREQAALYLSSNKDIGGVVVIAIFGVCYSWRNILRDVITDVSSNTDPSWKPSDQPSTDHDEGINRVAAAAVHAMPVAGPSDARPKRQPKPVERYQQYQKHKQLYFTSSEEDDSHLADRKGREKDQVSTKVDDTAKTKTVKGSVKKKGKKKGKAKCLSAEKPKPLQKPETVNESEPAALMPFLLELPPPLPVELRNQAPAAHTAGVATSTAGAGSAAAESSSASGSAASASSEQQPKSEDGGEQRRDEIECVPDDEQDWSAWYQWDSTDGRRERDRMFNAIQRWNPNRPFLNRA